MLLFGFPDESCDFRCDVEKETQSGAVNHC